MPTMHRPRRASSACNGRVVQLRGRSHAIDTEWQACSFVFVTSAPRCTVVNRRRTGPRRHPQKWGCRPISFARRVTEMPEAGHLPPIRRRCEFDRIGVQARCGPQFGRVCLAPSRHVRFRAPVASATPDARSAAGRPRRRSATVRRGAGGTSDSAWSRSSAPLSMSTRAAGTRRLSHLACRLARFASELARKRRHHDASPLPRNPRP